MGTANHLVIPYSFDTNDSRLQRGGDFATGEEFFRHHFQQGTNNIGEFLAEHSIDGGLVGGASLKPDEMAGMVARAALAARTRAAAEGNKA